MKTINFLEDKIRKEIGFQFVMDDFRVITAYGEKLKKNIEPFKDKKTLKKELENIQIIRDDLYNNIKIYAAIEEVLYDIKDISGTIERCNKGVILDEVEFYEVKYLCFKIRKLLELQEKLNVRIDEIRLHKIDKIKQLLDPGNYDICSFYIYDSYSEKLKAIRQEKMNIERLISNEIYKEDPKDSYIEKLKKIRTSIVVKEEAEELEIRKSLTGKLFFHLGNLEQNISAIGKLDFLIAKAKLGGVKPILSDCETIYIEEAYNPMIVEVLEKKGKEFSPITMEVEAGTTIITGANMGGKSVALQTIALNTLLVQMGFFPYCHKGVFPLVDFMYVISDDMQDVTKGLSTFGAEIIKLREAIDKTDNFKGLIILDELARGTNPKEGTNLVKAVCDYLNHKNSISIISTHYDLGAREDLVHYEVVGLKNINFDEIKLKINSSEKNSVEIIQEVMEYRLERVIDKKEVPKEALNICNLLGLREEIIEKAWGYYMEDTFLK